MTSDRVACVACHREIDAAAKLCPYCGADPRSGEKVDTQSLLEAEFKPKQLTASETVLDYARQRQGIVVALGIAAGLLTLVGLHAFVNHRNETQVSSAGAVPLAEVADVASQQENTPPPAMPELQFQYDGHPQSMRTFVIEPGAVTPPEVIAAQQAAAAAQKTTASPQQPSNPATQQPRPH
jgi:hypothetical protein